jgi:hypothetical protein
MSKKTGVQGLYTGKIATWVVAYQLKSETALRRYVTIVMGTTSQCAVSNSNGEETKLKMWYRTNSIIDFRMKLILLFCVLLGLFSSEKMYAAPADIRLALAKHTHESLSRQFVVHDPAVLDSYSPEIGSQGQFVKTIQLDPALLAVSCERIKKTFLGRLRLKDEWRGRMVIFLHHARSRDENILVRAETFEGNWIYTVDMPDMMERTRLISCVVELLVLEMADRGSDHKAEIPTWLVKGLSREIITTSADELVVESPHSVENGMSIGRVNRNIKANQRLLDLHAGLQNMPTLGIEELSWPGRDLTSDPDGDCFQNSAQLFIHELLELPDGLKAMREFIQLLPKYLNWQIAFFKAFGSDFSGSRDLDKWWDLTVVRFTTRDVSQTWPVEVSFSKLNAIIHPGVEIRTTPSQLPMQSSVSLQSIIDGWDVSNQIPVLRQKARELMVLQVGVARSVAPFVEAYRSILEGYVAKRENLANVPIGKHFTNRRTDDFAQETIEKLNRLDAQRNQLETSNHAGHAKPSGFPVVR